MMKFSTVTIDKKGNKWEAEYIDAINWEDAERQAKQKGVEIVGRLHEQTIFDNIKDKTNDIIIDYDIIQNN